MPHILVVKTQVYVAPAHLWGAVTLSGSSVIAYKYYVAFSIIKSYSKVALCYDKLIDYVRSICMYVAVATKSIHSLIKYMLLTLQNVNNNNNAVH